MTCAPKMRHNALIAAIALLSSVAVADDVHPIAAIRDQARQYVGQHLAAIGHRTEITVGKLDPRLRLPRCQQPLTAAPLAGSRPDGNTTITVRCDGDKPWRVHVPVTVSRYAPVVIAARPLQRGKPVTQQDFIVQERNVATLRSGYFEDIQMLIGRLPRRTLPQGGVLTPNDLDAAKLIRRGDRVTISTRGAGVSVKMAGTALSDGGKGERIQVKNLSSGRTVEVTVEAPGQVRAAM